MARNHSACEFSAEAAADSDSPARGAHVPRAGFNVCGWQFAKSPAMRLPTEANRSAAKKLLLSEPRITIELRAKPSELLLGPERSVQ